MYSPLRVGVNAVPLIESQTFGGSIERLSSLLKSCSKCLLNKFNKPFEIGHYQLNLAGNKCYAAKFIIHYKFFT